MATVDPADPIEPTTLDPAGLDGMLDRLGEPDALVVRARESLEATLSGLKLTPVEEAALGSEINQLRALTQKLDDATVEIAAFGMVSRGKSSVLNALLGQEVFRSGSTHGTTVDREASRWESVQPEGAGWTNAKLIRPKCRPPRRFDLVRGLGRHAAS